MKKAFVRNPDEDKARKELFVVAVVIVVVLLAVLLLPLAARFFSNRSEASEAQESTFKTALDAGEQTTREDGLTWENIYGIDMPISSIHGPLKAVNGVGSQFARTETGAALAATHHTLTTSNVVPQAMSDIAFGESVIGENKEALQISTNQKRSPTDLEGIFIVGWTVVEYSEDRALIRTAILSEQVLVHTDIQLGWQDNDWKMIAPPAWIIGKNILVNKVAPETVLNTNPSMGSLVESADGRPPTAEDFQPGTTLAAESGVEGVLKQFGQAYFSEDYKISYADKAQSLKNFTTSALYIQILEDQPDGFEAEQAKRFEKTVTVITGPTISKLSEGSYQIKAEVEERSTNESTQRLDKQIVVLVNQDSEAPLVSEILVGS